MASNKPDSISQKEWLLINYHFSYNYLTQKIEALEKELAEFREEKKKLIAYKVKYGI